MGCRDGQGSHTLGARRLGLGEREREQGPVDPLMWNFLWPGEVGEACSACVGI